ncbi:MAG: hypothetical protein RJA70_2917, partial [Pseudomonadota bacterium]
MPVLRLVTSPRPRWVSTLMLLLGVSACSAERAKDGAPVPPPDSVPPTAGQGGLANAPEPIAGGGGEGGTIGGGMEDAGATPVVSTAFVLGQVSGVQPPEAYVAKVKHLVNGGVPTSAEVEQIRANPAAMIQLVEHWMESPVFKEKMMAFLAESLQQGGIDAASLKSNQLRSYSQRSGWIREIVEMFPRTAWNIIEQDRPFTEIATTRTFMATTQLLVVLSYLDLSQKEGQRRDITVFKDVPPAGRTVPASWAESVSERLFQLPDQVGPAKPGDRCELPMTVTHDGFMSLLMGEHGADCAPKVLSIPFVSDSDRSDWRAVELGDAAIGDPTIPYFDLPQL